MPTLDEDFECEQDDESGCYGVWQTCETCFSTDVPDIPGYFGGLVSRGCGYNYLDHPGNLWYDTLANLDGKYDICIECTGSGGGYVCGIHDKEV